MSSISAAKSPSNLAREEVSPSSGDGCITPPSGKSGSVDANYNPQSPRFWLVILSVYLCSFLVALDRLIISTALPSITNTFDSILDIGWYGSAYMLACAVFSPFFGKIYQLHDTKWTYLVSIAIFEIGSALCGASSSSVALIVGRAVAGAGAAGIFCGAIMVIVPMVPLQKRPLFLSFFGMSFAISSVLGPLIGGAFTDSHKLTWRWSFYINLPIGGLAASIVFFFLHLPPRSKPASSLKTEIMRLDPLGMLLLVPSIISLVLALQWVGTTESWSSPKIIGLLVTFAVLFIAFLAVEFTMPETAMAPRRVVLNRSVGASFFFIFVMYGGMMNAVYYLAIWFQAARGNTAMQAGIHTIPLVLSLVLCGLASAIITQRIGYYVPALFVSSVLASIGGGLLSTLTTHSSKGSWIGFQVIYGFGLGAGGQTSNLVAQTVLPKSDIALGTALGFFVQQLGGAIFLSVGQHIFSRALVERLSGIAGLNAQMIVNTGVTDLRTMVPSDVIETVINAYSNSLTRVFILTAALSASMMLGVLAIEWRSIKNERSCPLKGSGLIDGKNAGNGAEEDVEKNATKNRADNQVGPRTDRDSGRDGGNKDDGKIEGDGNKTGEESREGLQ